MTWTREAIHTALRATDLGRVTVALAAGDAAWNPRGPVITGPATVEYVLYLDGAIGAHVIVI